MQESYTIEVVRNPQAKIVLRAETAVGIIRSVETLFQLAVR